MGRGKGEKGKGKTKSLPHKDMMLRMNFLYQASTYMAQLSSEHLNNISKTISENNKIDQIIETSIIENGQNKLQFPKEPSKNVITQGKSKNLKMKIGQPGLCSVSRYYNRHLKGISRKLVLRLDPSIKRTLCKRCDQPLIPGKTCHLTVEDWLPNNPTPKSYPKIKPELVPALLYQCSFCGLHKRIPQQPDYLAFTERPENLIT